MPLKWQQRSGTNQPEISREKGISETIKCLQQQLSNTETRTPPKPSTTTPTPASTTAVRPVVPGPDRGGRRRGGRFLFQFVGVQTVVLKDLAQVGSVEGGINYG